MRRIHSERLNNFFFSQRSMLAGKSIMPYMKHIQIEMKTRVLGSHKNILWKPLQGLLLNRENGSLQWWWCSVGCVRSVWGRNNIFFYKGICSFLLNPLKHSSPEILCLDAKGDFCSHFCGFLEVGQKAHSWSLVKSIKIFASLESLKNCTTAPVILAWKPGHTNLQNSLWAEY